MMDQVEPASKNGGVRQGKAWRAILARIQNFTSEVFEDLAPTANDSRNCKKMAHGKDELGGFASAGYDELLMPGSATVIKITPAMSQGYHCWGVQNMARE